MKEDSAKGSGQTSNFKFEISEGEPRCVKEDSAKGSGQTASGDMDAESFRKYGYQVIDWIADYLSHLERYPVLAQVEPGRIKNELPCAPPERGESMDAILKDIDEIIVPGITHWNHHSFFAYFANTGSAPGILGELLSAAFNTNGMLWKTSPAATELEEVALDWLRQLLGLPPEFFGIIYDTASTSTLHALAAAREATDLKIREQGMASRSDLPRLRLYISEHAHSAADKAAILIGIGQAGVRKIASDEQFRMKASALAEAVEQDINEGWRPLCVIATVGTTSTASIDPVPEIADICAEHNIWLHVDAAYAGVAAILPEMRYIFDGCDRADSLVLNPHKWLFTPMDLSVFYCRKPEILRRAFSLVPEFLRTAEDSQVINYMDYGIPLGRRFRALKLWMIIRYFGYDGLAARIREHIRIARQFADWIDGDEDFQRLAPTYFSLVCFRACPRDLAEKLKSAESGEGDRIESYLDGLNEALINAVNATGQIFLSHTRLNGRFTVRLAIGNIRTTEEHVRRAWELLRQQALRLDSERRIIGRKS